jgi:hypothetical protein
MTNQELQQAFENINLPYENVFDHYMGVEKLTKDYKITPFYKSTGKTVQESYALYNSHAGKLDSFIRVLSTDDRIERFLHKFITAFDLENYLNNELSPSNREVIMEMLPLMTK